MARDPKRMALYEAIKKGQSKSQGGRKTVLFRPFGFSRARFGRKRKIEASMPRRLKGTGAGYMSRRRSLGFLRNRFNLSPRGLAIVVVAAAAIVFGSVRVGESLKGRKWLIFEPKAAVEQPGGGVVDPANSIFPPPVTPRTVTPAPEQPVNVPRPRTVNERPNEPAQAPAPQGTNVVVIQAYKQRKDLEPVQQHFAANGIETEIVERGSYFFLVTKQLYQRCSAHRDSFNPKFDGDVARKKIQDVGSAYRAPAGFETFRPNLFQDAYAEKVR